MFKMFVKDPQCKIEYAKEGDSGADLRAFIATTMEIAPGHRATIPTGVFVQMPIGYELQVRPRSGLAHKQGVTVLNSPGTIDACYRGEIGVIIINHDLNDTLVVKPFDKIAQAVVQAVLHPAWEMVDTVEELSETDRGTGGFGSTGVSG